MKTHATPAPDFAARRRRFADALTAGEIGSAIVLIGAGEPVSIPGGLDQVYPFRAHPDYWYLTGENRPGSLIAYDPQDGPVDGWVAFSHPPTPAERTWEGECVVVGRPMVELAAWLAARRGRSVALLGAPLPGVAADPALSARLAAQTLHARRVKDAAEVAAIRRAVEITAPVFAALPSWIRPGVTERALRDRILSGFIAGGADGEGYGTIVGIGPDAAVLHFSPGARAAGDSDFVLIDAGAELNRYTADVTRTYPVAPRNVTPTQRDFYNAVLHAQQRAAAGCRDGVEVHDLHRRCAEDMAAGLVQMGLLAGSPAELVERGVMALFFPHGLGHLVGLGVRDASGCLPGRTHRPGPGGTAIRLDLPLRAGYCMTIEPGLYFIPALIDGDEPRSRFRDAVRWSEVDRARKEIQGVRIEDNVLVTAGEPEVLTAGMAKALA